MWNKEPFKTHLPCDLAVLAFKGGTDFRLNRYGWDDVERNGVVLESEERREGRGVDITLLRSITILCGTNNTPQKISHI